MVQGCLGEQGQRVGLLLAEGWRVGGRILERFRLREHLPARLERLHQHRPGLRLQPPVDDYHTVFVLIHMEPAPAMALPTLLGFPDPVNPPPGTDDALDVLGGTGPADLEQPLFCLGRRDPGQRPDLGV